MKIIGEGILLSAIFRFRIVLNYLSHKFEKIKITFWQSDNLTTHIAQNIAKTCQKYFQYFIATEILSQHFYQILQNI